MQRSDDSLQGFRLAEEWSSGTFFFFLRRWMISNCHSGRTLSKQALLGLLLFEELKPKLNTDLHADSLIIVPAFSVLTCISNFADF